MARVKNFLHRLPSTRATQSVPGSLTTTMKAVSRMQYFCPEKSIRDSSPKVFIGPAYADTPLARCENSEVPKANRCLSLGKVYSCSRY